MGWGSTTSVGRKRLGGIGWVDGKCGVTSGCQSLSPRGPPESKFKTKTTHLELSGKHTGKLETKKKVDILPLFF